MRLKIHQFLKQYSIFESGKLQHPKLNLLAKLELPQESIVHFFDPNQAVHGPARSDPLFVKNTAKTYIEHVTDLMSLEGNPRRSSMTANKLLSDYKRQNVFFKPLTKDQAVTINPLSVLVVNYNMLDPQWIYPPNFKSTWYRWSNNQKTFWERVVQVHRRFGWNQFIEVHLPEQMPTLQMFNKLRNGQTTQTLETFSQTPTLNLFDIYRWLGPERQTSHLAVLEDEMLDKINLLVRMRDRFVVLNLGLLNSWRDDTKDEEAALERFIEACGNQAVTPSLESVDDEHVLARRSISNSLFDLGLTDQASIEEFIETFGMEAFFPPMVMQRRVISLFGALTEYNQQAEAMPTDSAGVLDDLVDVVDEAGMGEQDADNPDEIPPDKMDEPDSAEADEVPVVEVVAPTLDFGGLDITYTPPEADLFTTKLELEQDAEVEIDRSKEIKVVATKAKPLPESIANAEDVISGVTKPAFDLVEVGLISPRAFEQAEQQANTFKTMKNPFGGDETFEEAMTYKPEDFTIPVDTNLPDSNTILDKSMLGSKLKAMNRKYNQSLRKKDILQAVLSVQKAGVAVVGHNVEVVRDSMNHYEIHTVSVKPIRGKVSPLRFRVPVVDRDGRFMSNGVTYRMRMQRADIPIRKVDAAKVALTSYFNKTFVTRSDRAVHNYDAWILRQLRSRALDLSDASVEHVMYADLDQRKFALPRVYSQLGKAFRGFTTGPVALYFKFEDHAEYLLKKYSLDVMDYEKNGMILVGAYKGKQAVVLDKRGIFYVQTGENLEPLGTIIDIVGIDVSTAPLEATDLTVGAKALPLGFVLCYQYGLQATLQRLGAKVERHNRGERFELSANSYAVVFQDQVLVFDRSDYRTMLIMGGFRRYAKLMKNYPIQTFESKDVYHRLLIDSGMTSRFTKEIDALFTQWVDPITEGLLKQMNEPTTFDGLLYRSLDMLLIDWSPPEVDGAYMRYRGYERMAGTIFNEVNKAVKQFNNQSGTSQVQVLMDPSAVWKKITQDPTVMVVEDSNPLANIREQESMTYRGDGGRSTQSMVARTRVYGEADVGVVSESTVDSGDVGVIAYLTPDANFDSMRGTTRPFDPTTDGPARQLSTCALLGVATTNDDPKRINFVSIQQQQGIYADGYEPTPLRTGYEQIVAQRTSSIFASAAEQDGKVTAVDEHGITVLYADGEIISYQMGNIHGSAAGVHYPHAIKSDLKVGDAFKRGDTLAYNEKYFQPDRMSPGQVIWKAGVNTIVAFCDNLDTLEDGSVISEDLARKLNTQTTEVKNISARFDQTVAEMVKVGDHVDLETILCMIKDPETAGGSVFDEVSRETLRKLSAYSPRAKVVGRVSKIEVFYHGDLEDMTPELRKVAQESDALRQAQSKSRNEPYFSGQVDHEYRTKGRGLEPDSLVINVYIDHDIPCGVGDKGVVANQMKTVFSRVMRGENRTKSGLPIGLLFGNTSVEERMVLSPKLIATTTILLAHLSKHVAAVYRGTANARAK
jgi:hypothetical protein